MVPDQLKIADGWVRCGHCSDVFDAMLNLQSSTPGAQMNSPPAAPTAAGSAGRVLVRRVHTAPVKSPPPPPPPANVPFSALGPTQKLVRAPGNRAVPTPPSNPERDIGFPGDALSDNLVVEPAVDDDWDGEWLFSAHTMAQPRDSNRKALDVQREPVGRKDSDPGFEQDLMAFANTGQQREADVSALSSAPHLRVPNVLSDRGLEHGSKEPGFVVQGRRDAFWRSPAVRATLFALASVLGGFLALQWAVHERNLLAARYPAWEPILQAVCGQVGCTLAAPQRIDAVAIESSTLVRKRGQFYTFDLVLKNSEPMVVAMPALELSLTDGRDKEIARRVFLPEDMPGTPTVVPANGSLSVNMRLSLSESELSTMAGFRALVFYP